MIDFFMEFSGRTPSSLTRMLNNASADAVVDQSLLFWMESMSRLQIRIARSLLNQVKDDLFIDPSGQRAFQHGIERLSELSRHPLDAE
jgi:hypothetical protein